MGRAKKSTRLGASRWPLRLARTKRSCAERVTTRFADYAVVATTPAWVHLNRDYDAAINIQRRCVSLLAGEAHTHMDAADEQLEALELRVRVGD